MYGGSSANRVAVGPTCVSGPSSPLRLFLSKQLSGGEGGKGKAGIKSEESPLGGRRNGAGPCKEGERSL